jgi:hypothetical protein
MPKRKTMTKKARFEVFKRDSFRCQYCGGSAPDVILQVDHIKPVADGGTNDMTNLVTSCVDCNQGKKDRLLDDHSVLEKQRQQLEEINERRLQLEMMREWRESLVDFEQDKMDIIKEKWSDLTGYHANKTGEKIIKRWLKRYDMNTILDSMGSSTDQYLRTDEDGDYTQESVEKTFNYIGRICSNKEKYKDKPHLKDLYYIRGILRNRLHYCNEHQALKLLEEAYHKGASMESLKGLALDVKNWTQFKGVVEDFLEGEQDE